MNGRTLTYWRSGGMPLVIGIRPDLEAQGVREDERRQPEQGVGDDVEGDEQAVVAPYHVSPGRAAIVSHAALSHLVAEARPAEPFGVRANRGRVESPAEHLFDRGRGKRVGRRLVHEHAGLAGTTVSSAPPRPSATTGRPHACASSGTMPKSSSPGSSATAAPAVQVADLLVGAPPQELDVAVRPARSSRAPFGAVCRRSSAARPPAGRPRWRGRSACRGRAPTR